MDWDNFCSIPMLIDILKVIERCSDTSSLIRHLILVGILLGPVDLLGLKVELISIITFFVQGEIKSESTLCGGKYS